MYKMSYYRLVTNDFSSKMLIDIPRFTELFGGHPAQDRVRNQRIPNAGIQLDVLGKCPVSVSLSFILSFSLIFHHGEYPSILSPYNCTSGLQIMLMETFRRSFHI
jgi:hypothetical protein